MAPRDIRLFVVDSLVKAFETNVAKRKINPRHRFTMHPKRGEQNDSITCEYKSVKVIEKQVTLFGKSKQWGIGPITMKESFCTSKICHNVSISRCNGQFYLLLSFDTNKSYLLCKNKKDKLAKRKSIIADEQVVAIDPGVRKMMTYFSPEGSCGYIGSDVNGCKKVKRLRQRISSLTKHRKVHRSCFIVPVSEKDMKWKQRRSTRRKRQAVRRCHERITNFVDDQHCKACHWFSSRYDTILIPKLSVSRMVQKHVPLSDGSSMVTIRKKRKLSSRTCQDMLTLGHSIFLSRLLQKRDEYLDQQVLSPSEAYTSGTCGVCGTINECLGSSEVFKCVNVGCVRHLVAFDRDLHAARNLRWLSTQ